mmetsp:Transcript_24113/g.41286  ORF Transcript_24113/g.41286 Transcript_24113/m.41286 type:complete len:101 (+) Transcript_24113:221-523(+)
MEHNIQTSPKKESYILFSHQESHKKTSSSIIFYSLYGIIWHPNKPRPAHVRGRNSIRSVLITSTNPPNSVVFLRTATGMEHCSAAAMGTNSAMARKLLWF